MRVVPGRGSLIAASAAGAVLLALPVPAGASHQSDVGWIEGGVGSEEEARAYPCPVDAAGEWERVGPVVCLDKLTDQWDLVQDDMSGCTYDATGWRGDCIFDIDMDSYVKVWGTRGSFDEKFTITWLHGAGQSPSPSPTPSPTSSGSPSPGPSANQPTPPAPPPPPPPPTPAVSGPAAPTPPKPVTAGAPASRATPSEVSGAGPVEGPTTPPGTPSGQAITDPAGDRAPGRSGWARGLTAAVAVALLGTAAAWGVRVRRGG